MKKYFVVPVILASIFLGSCSSATDPEPNPNPNPNQNADTVIVDSTTTRRVYNTSKRGVQITRINFDQGWNDIMFGVEDEWVILEADGNIATKGWHLDADDEGQRYALPDTIYRKLYIYTHQGRGYENDTSMTLKLNGTRWIWNNNDPDTARLYDANDALMDVVGYKAVKK